MPDAPTNFVTHTSNALSVTRLFGLGLTPGKLRGLQRISNDNGTLTMVATDQNSAMIGLMALPFGPWWVAALTFFAMLGVPSIRVLVDVLVFRQTPDAERGRVIAAVMVLIGLGMPVGVFFTGMLLQYLSASAALLVLAGVLTAAVAIFGTRRELVRAQWPQQG